MDRRVWIGGLAAVLVVVFAAWAFGFIGGVDPAVAELQQMREQMSSNPNMPDAERQQLRDSFRQRMEGLSEDQRRAIFSGNREEWARRNEQRMDQFFAMSVVDQRKQLDESINRMVERAKQQGQNGGVNRGGPNGAATAGAANGNAAGNGRNGGQGRGPMTAAQRDQRAKERLDRSTPKQRAQRAAYRQKLEQRMQQRGIDPRTMPGGGPGGGGRRLA